MPIRTVAVLLLATAALLTSCGDDGSDDASKPSPGDDRLAVAASFFPIETVVAAVGGENVRLVPLVPPGEEAHDYEPTPEQVAALEDADVVFYLGNDLQPGVEDALDALPSDVRTVDLLEGLPLLPIADGDGDDPHVWLDPANMALMSRTVADVLTELDPEHASETAANDAAFQADMEALDTEISDLLTTCEARVVVTTHRAFGYLTHRYDLEQLSIAGISPSEEPSAKTLEAIADAAREHGVTTVFFEENLPDDLARTVADEIGAEVGVLDPIESPSRDQLDAGETYRSIMLANAATLADGLGCA